MTLFDEPKPKRERPRDELFERLLGIFHPTLKLDKIPDNTRGRLNMACKAFRQWPDFDIDELMVRYGRMKGRTAWRSALALANHWDEFDGEERTTQPGASSKTETAERLRVARETEQDQHVSDQARLVVQAAPDGVAAALLKQWKSYPENKTIAKFVTSPTHGVCVRWIAAELEARNV